ncbi:MAG: hypothetical protein HQK50_00655 [Oligoflexia bacterium]|nr:hypothetical protein [Oligoflexia bacterium]MBF0364045.1 hypothetical protein [Oligoflexia bacterium]
MKIKTITFSSFKSLRPLGVLGSILLGSALYIMPFQKVFSTDHDDTDKDFTVHEWGTFTSLQGADGKVLEGMHHEEEHLPPFVHGRCKISSSTSSIYKDDFKCIEMLLPPFSLQGVTQKMETPVLFFYSKVPVEAQVKVDFPKGIISQWYPTAASFFPPISGIRGALAGGSMVWNIKVQTETLATPPVDSNSVWAPSRQVASNFLLAPPSREGGQEEAEKFIFYRGLGSFDTPMSVKTDKQGVFTITNASSEKIPAAFLLDFNGVKGFIIPLEDLKSKNEAIVHRSSLDDKWLPKDEFLNLARDLVTNALLNSGLFPDEALALVDTWSNSYFLGHGTRLLYVLPDQWTNELLPLAILPTPSHLVRTLVGRIEIFSADEEEKLLTAIKDSPSTGNTLNELISSLGRLAEPKLRRLLILTSDEEVKKRIQDFFAPRP